MLSNRSVTKFLVIIVIHLLFFPAHVSGVSARRCVSNQIASSTCDCLAGDTFRKMLVDNCPIGGNVFDGTGIVKECKRQSALCSRDSLVDLVGCLNVPSLPPRNDEACKCRDDKCFNEWTAMKRKTQKACCAALSICWKAKKCVGGQLIS